MYGLKIYLNLLLLQTLTLTTLDNTPPTCSQEMYLVIRFLV